MNTHISGTKEAVTSNLQVQFNFGAKLIAFPHVERWDKENSRLQSVTSYGELIPDVWTYRWQTPVEQDGTYVAGHIDQAGYSPTPLRDLYPDSLFEEYDTYPLIFVDAVKLEYPNGFTEDQPEFTTAFLDPFTSGEDPVMTQAALDQFLLDYPTAEPKTFLDLHGHLSATEYVVQEIIDADSNITVLTS